MAYRGVFQAKNHNKYKGDASKIVYRSRWELLLMMRLDEHPDVLEWSSEEIVIPYISPVDGRRHRYFCDFFVKRKGANGLTECFMIEVKPHAQTRPPAVKIKKGQKPSRGYLNEVATWGVNSAKWKAAQAYCADRGWKFIIMTENELGIKF